MSAWAMVVFMLVVGIPALVTQAAASFADPAFRSIWDRTDSPVAANRVQRTFLWGPAPITAGMQEKYAQGPGGTRLVQYFDKSRMEITDPGALQSSPFYVTNGLLVTELMTGRVQTGNDPSQVDLRDPANINAVGDSDDPNAPTYQTLARLRDQPARTIDSTIKELIDRGATISAGGPDGVTAAVLVPETRHAVASVFWAFMNSSGQVSDGTGGTVNAPLFTNPFYATGLPITEAYWTLVRVGGVQKQVLVQAFERRVLTYTPDNPDGYKVEAGNVGAHYYQWRYGTKQPTIVDPTTAPSPIQPGNVLNGKYNLLPSDVPDGFHSQLDGEASNGFVARNDTDPNYTTYLRQWQRLTGYRRAFYRNEASSQVSALQSMVSVFRNADGALAELTYDRDRKRVQPNVTVMDGYFGTNSYLVIDRSNATAATLYSLVWQQANTLNSIDLTSPPRVGSTPADAVDLAGKVSHRITLDITTS
jgi:hypothetical protein